MKSLLPADPCWRLILCVVFAGLVVSLEHVGALALALALAGGFGVAVRLAPVPTLRRLAALDGFMILALALLPFTVPGTPLIEIAGLPASGAGARAALIILLKANIVALTILALLGTLEPVALGLGLARLGVPEKLVLLLLLTVRYIDVMKHEYQRLRTAMRARGFEMHWSRHCWRSVGYLFGMLLVRSLERAERIVAAMRCRGFEGRFHSLSELPPAAPHEKWLTAGWLSAAVLLVAWTRT